MATLFVVMSNISASEESEAAYRSEAEKLQILSVLAKPWEKTRQFLIEYEGLPTHGLQTTFVPVHKTMAVTSHDYYHLAAHSFPGIPWQQDPYAQELIIHDGKWRHGWPFCRAYSRVNSITNGEFIPGTTYEDVLLPILPVWPLTEYRIPANDIISTPTLSGEALRMPGYRLLAHSECIGNESCAIFDYDDIDRMWIATNKGFCLMRRDYKDPNSKEVYERILTDRLDEVAPGLWLPTIYRVQSLDSTRKQNRDTLTREVNVRIVRCLWNDQVPTQIFIAEHPSGALEYEQDHSTQVAAGGEELLMNYVGFMTTYGHMPTKPLPQRHRWLPLFAGLLTALFVSGNSTRWLTEKCFNRPNENKYGEGS